MRKVVKKKIKDVLLHLGAKKQVIKNLMDESEDLDSAFNNAGELPVEPKASPEIQVRFNEYMRLESEVDLWFNQKIDQLNGMPEKTKEILNVVSQDASNFINRIDNI